MLEKNRIDAVNSWGRGWKQTPANNDMPMHQLPCHEILLMKDLLKNWCCSKTDFGHMKRVLIPSLGFKVFWYALKRIGRYLHSWISIPRGVHNYYLNITTKKSRDNDQ